jgi:hypothetical protein
VRFSFQRRVVCFLVCVLPERDEGVGSYGSCMVHARFMHGSCMVHAMVLTAGTRRRPPRR